MPQDGKVLGSVTRPDPTIVFAEGNVEHPVDGVLDAPMSPCSFKQPFGIAVQAGDVVPRLHGGCLTHDPFSGHHCNGLELFPCLDVLDILQLTWV